MVLLLRLFTYSTEKVIIIRSEEFMDKENNYKIYIIGSDTLPNQFLQYVITKELGILCEISRNLPEINKESVGSDVELLLLIDSSEHSFEETLKVVEMIQDDEHINLALFNMNHNTLVEKKALSMGIKGFFYQTDSFELFIKGVKSLFNDEVWISRNILVKFVLDSFDERRAVVQEKTNLTQREIEILNLVSLGAQNDEIADKMCISTNTVKTHLYNIFKKIDVPNRLQAALWASKNL